MTFPIFSVSSAISPPNSAGEPASGVPPGSASCALKAGSASAALTARLSAAMASAGVPLGAQAVPGAEFVAGQELAEGRNIRQHVRARRRRHAERPELARHDVGDRRGHGTEIDLHLACQQVAQRLHAAARDVERFSKPEVGGSNPLGDANFLGEYNLLGGRGYDPVLEFELRRGLRRGLGRNFRRTPPFPRDRSTRRACARSRFTLLATHGTAPRTARGCGHVPVFSGRPPACTDSPTGSCRLCLAVAKRERVGESWPRRSCAARTWRSQALTFWAPHRRIAR